MGWGRGDGELPRQQRLRPLYDGVNRPANQGAIFLAVRQDFSGSFLSVDNPIGPNRGRAVRGLAAILSEQKDVVDHGKECEGTRGGDQAASDWPALISKAAGATRPPKTIPIAPAVRLCSLAGTATASAIVPTEATRERVARARVRDIRVKG
jgi:hypothetical protein